MRIRTCTIILFICAPLLLAGCATASVGGSQETGIMAAAMEEGGIKLSLAMVLGAILVLVGLITALGGTALSLMDYFGQEKEKRRGNGPEFDTLLECAGIAAVLLGMVMIFASF